MADVVKPTERDQLLLRLRKLKISVSEQIPYNLESVFAQTSGWGGDGEIIRRAKLHRQVEAKLEEMLLPNEQVLYIAKGVQHSILESYFMGAWMASLMNQTVFVLTNLRLLMLRSNSSGKPLEMFWVIYYSEIDKFTPSWTGVLSLKLRDRKYLSFAGFNGRDRKAMPAIFQEAINQYRRLGFEPTVSQSRENLCAHCYQVVPSSEFICRTCGAEYWRPRDLALRSLVFPSWGDICMKHYGMAAMEIVGYITSWWFALQALNGPDLGEGLAFVAIILLVEHPLDAIITYNIANKGLNPRHDPDRIGGLAIDEVEEVVDEWDR